MEQHLLDVATFKSKLNKGMVSKGAITPELLAAHRRQEARRKVVHQKGLDGLSEILNTDAIKEFILLETAKEFVAKEGIDLDFISENADESLFRDIDVAIAEFSRQKIRKMAA